MTKRAFGELEFTILNILKPGNRMTVKEVWKILGESNKYNTIMTVMNRLAEKKVIARERIGLQYEYWVLPSQKKIPSFLEQFKQKFFGVKTSAMVSYLLESAEDISDEDLAEMEKMIEKAKKERKKS
jgi:predicted transcriptional regulator